MSNQRRPGRDPELRRRAIEFVRESPWALNAIARHLGVDRQTIRAWVRRAGYDPAERPMGKSKGGRPRAWRPRNAEAAALLGSVMEGR